MAPSMKKRRKEKSYLSMSPLKRRINIPMKQNFYVLKILDEGALPVKVCKSLLKYVVRNVKKNENKIRKYLSNPYYIRGKVANT